MNDLANPMFQDEALAREWLEARIWPNGPVCPHCGSTHEDVRKLEGKAHRPGLYQCNACREQFTATVGTVFERSKIPLTKWLMALYLLNASKKGISTHQMHRMLGVSYKSTWFMTHRLREAMKAGGFAGPIGGAGKHVEADETFIGRKRGRAVKQGHHHKRVVLSLVERGGEVRSFHIEHATVENIKPIIDRHVDKASTLNTDEASQYVKLGREFAAHGVVHHAAKEYTRGTAYTNTLEGYFSIFKRGMTGVYQHCAEKHLHRYLAEFDFRYNSRDLTDMERAELAAKGIVGKRLTYRRTGSQATA